MTQDPPAAPTSTSEPSAPATPGLSRRRRLVIVALIVVASLLAFVTVAALYVDRQILDDEQWQTSSEELVQDPEIQAAVAAYVVDELYAEVDVAGTLGERLPPGLERLAPTVAAALRQPAVEAVEALLARPRVQQAWLTATGLVHERLMNVLEDETGFGISTGEGVVTLDLGELVTEIGRQLGVSEDALARLPADAGVITLMESDQLSAAQAVVNAIRVMSVWLFALVLAMFAAAVVLARGRRREILRDVGLAFALIGLVTLVARGVAGDYIVSELTSPASERSGERVWLISTGVLRDIGWACVLYGLVTAAAAVLAGPQGWATAARRRIAPVLNERPGVAFAAVAFAYLLVVLWGGTHALRTPWGVLLLGALLAIGVVALRRQTQREFPTGLETPGGVAGGNGASGSAAPPAGPPLDGAGSHVAHGP